MARYLSEGVIENAVNLAAVPAERMSTVAPWQTLARHLGATAAALSAEAPSRARLVVVGEALGEDRAALLPEALAGLFTPFAGAPLNAISARPFAEERGVEVGTQVRESAGRWPRQLSLVVEAEGGASCTVSGTVGADQLPRLVAVGAHRLDLPFAGPVVLIENRDQPGVVAHLGRVLGEAGLNIAHMSVGRAPEGAEALSGLVLDQKPEPSVLEALRAHDAVRRAVALAGI